MRYKYLNKLKYTLRGRLSFLYVISLLLIVSIFLWSIYALFWFTLQGQIDHHVHVAVNEAKNVVENYHGTERDGLIKSLVSAKGMTVVVLSPDGSPILETNSPDVALITEHELQQILASTNKNDSYPVHFTENNIRFAAMPVVVSSGKGIVAVGYSTKILRDTFVRMLLITTAVIILLVLPVSLLGYYLLKRELSPLEKIAQQAKSITNTRELTKRISVGSTTKELKSIQASLNNMLEQLEEIFKNEHVFFSDAAHTLKTPLAVLRSELENSVVKPESKNLLIKTVDNINSTVQDLLFLSKTGNQVQNKEKVNLSTIMNHLFELAGTLGEEKDLVVASNIENDIFIEAEKNLLQRALGNIVYNAILYNKPGGTVDISLIKKNQKISISIKDSGVGINKGDLPSIFERFYRGKNSSESGSGLGLAISKSVIESLGGTISIKSAINKGTTVNITF